MFKNHLQCFTGMSFFLILIISATLINIYLDSLREQESSESCNPLKRFLYYLATLFIIILCAFSLFPLYGKMTHLLVLLGALLNLSIVHLHSGSQNSPYLLYLRYLIKKHNTVLYQKFGIEELAEIILYGNSDFELIRWLTERADPYQTICWLKKHYRENEAQMLGDYCIFIDQGFYAQLDYCFEKLNLFLELETIPAQSSGKAKKMKL